MKLVIFNFLVVIAVCTFIAHFSESHPKRLKMRPVQHHQIQKPKETPDQQKMRELIKEGERLTGMKGNS